MSVAAISLFAAAAGFSAAIPAQTSEALSRSLIYVSSSTPVSSPTPILDS